MNPVSRQVDDLKRLDEILRILSDEGFHLVLDRLDLTHRLPLLERLKPRRKQIPPPERVRETFEELGPTFIKFGQILAQRPDILPERYIDELEKLEDSVPPFDPEKAREILEEEVDTDRFSSFEEEPVAAASIAQVHEARLDSGEKVAVKIRRPGIEEQVRKDLDIIEFLAGRAENISGRLNSLHVQEMVEEFSDWTRDELDLEREGRNAEILAKNLQDEEKVRVPKIYSDLSTKKVLVMEYVDGVKSNDIEAIRELGIEKEELARTAIRTGLKQVIVDGFFHADPHPSNFLINKDGELVFLDFGMMGQLPKKTRKYLGMLMMHALEEDVDGAMNVVKALGHVQEDADLEGLEEEIERKIMLLQNSTLEEESVSKHLLDITVTATRKGVIMPTNLVIMGKTLVTLEGIGLSIYPELNIKQEFKPITEEVIREQYSIDDLMEKFYFEMVENSESITELPAKLGELADSREQEVKVVNETDSHATIVSGLLVSSAVLMIKVMPSRYAAGLASAFIFLAALIYLR